MGTTHNAIPSRLERGEVIDVVIMAGQALANLIEHGKVRADSRVDLVQSKIGMAVKAGAPKPDIATVDALKRTLLAAKSIAYSDSASGVYLSTELFPKLGIANQIKGKTRKIEADPVGGVVAKGEAEIGFQQMSELLPVKGIDIVGPLPAGAQRITVFAAGIPVSSTQPEPAKGPHPVACVTSRLYDHPEEWIGTNKAQVNGFATRRGQGNGRRADFPLCDVMRLSLRIMKGCRQSRIY